MYFRCTYVTVILIPCRFRYILYEKADNLSPGSRTGGSCLKARRCRGRYHLPKHLLWFVARSTYTLALITLPNGINICASSASPNS